MNCPVCGKDLEVVGEFAVCPAHGALPVNVCWPADTLVETDLVATTYLYRNGVRHLLEMGRRADALALLTDFGYLMDRMRHLGDPQAAESVLADWRAVASGVLAKDELWWAVFFQERAHLLRRGSSPWPAYKILLQLAVEHADASPVTWAAERWLAAGHCDWVWFRNR
jgi:hypothetical protein